MLHYNEWTEKLSKIIYCEVSKLNMEILEDSDYLFCFILDTQYVLWLKYAKT